MDPDRTRYYYMTAARSDQVYVAIKEYAIEGDALDFSNWDLTGREWEIPTEVTLAGLLR